MDWESILKRRKELLAGEQGSECRWYWLSFADEKGFKGGCFVLAPGFVSAVERARDLGLSPGGEVIGIAANTAPPPEMQNRLLSEGDLEASGGAVPMRTPGNSPE
jgi:hypothetical protein